MSKVRAVPSAAHFVWYVALACGWLMAVLATTGVVSLVVVAVGWGIGGEPYQGTTAIVLLLALVVLIPTAMLGVALFRLGLSTPGGVGRLVTPLCLLAGLVLVLPVYQFAADGTFWPLAQKLTLCGGVLLATAALVSGAARAVRRADSKGAPGCRGAK